MLTPPPAVVKRWRALVPHPVRRATLTRSSHGQWMDGEDDGPGTPPRSGALDSERLLILRDHAGALEAARRHIESPALGLFATRERALAVAVQALQELGRGEEAFELVLCTLAGPGGSESSRYMQVAELNLGLLKLLFRLRRHLDGSPKRAQSILAPYVAGLCRRRGDAFQRWGRADGGDAVDIEVVELFLLDCVLALEGAEVATSTLESFASALPPDAVSYLRREILRSELKSPSGAPADAPVPVNSEAAGAGAAAAATTNAPSPSCLPIPGSREVNGELVTDNQDASGCLLPVAHTPQSRGSHSDATANQENHTGTLAAVAATVVPQAPPGAPTLAQRFAQLFPGVADRFPRLRASPRLQVLLALMSLVLPVLLFWASRNRAVRRWLRALLVLLQSGGGGGGGARMWGPLCLVISFLVCFIVAL